MKTPNETFLDTLEGLINNGRFDKAQSGLKSILSRDPENARAKALLAQAEQAATQAPPQTQKGIHLQALRCPNCQASLSPAQDAAKSISCNACGALLGIEGPAAVLLAEQRRKAYLPEGYISLGLEGTLEGKRLQVIGRICYDCEMKEWDAEDREYVRGTWNYDEWLLVNQDKEYIFIEQDTEGYSLSKKFIPSEPKIPDPADSFISLLPDQRQSRILERGIATAQFLEGEFTWEVAVGDKSHYVDVQGLKQETYSIEWRFNKQDAIEEVEFFRSRPLPKLEIFRAFDLKAELAKEEARLANQKLMRKVAAAFLVLALFLFGSAAYNASKGKTIYDRWVETRLITEGGLLFGPVNLSQKDGLYSIGIVGRLGDNQEMWAGVELLDADQSAINASDKEFWVETGYDDEGSWKEEDVSSELFFRLDEPGSYYLRVFADEAPNNSALRLIVQEGLGMSRYYFSSGVMALILAVCLAIFASTTPIWIAFLLILISSVTFWVQS